MSIPTSSGGGAAACGGAAEEAAAAPLFCCAAWGGGDLLRCLGGDGGKFAPLSEMGGDLLRWCLGEETGAPVVSGGRRRGASSFEDAFAAAAFAFPFAAGAFLGGMFEVVQKLCTYTRILFNTDAENGDSNCCSFLPPTCHCTLWKELFRYSLRVGKIDLSRDTNPIHGLYFHGHGLPNAIRTPIHDSLPNDRETEPRFTIQSVKLFAFNENERNEGIQI